MEQDTKPKLKLLIIYPHRPPSNLVGIQRIRHLYNYLPQYNIETWWLCVHPDYYEEPHDFNNLKLIKDNQNIIDCKALKPFKPRLFGDIGIRGFFHLYKRAKHVINEKRIDFIYISIPSFYTALLGPLLKKATKKPYGIDYQDPWVRNISTRKNIRAYFSNFLAKVMEPVAVKKASMITGVSKSYYSPIIKKYFYNTSKGKSILCIDFPVGYDIADYGIEIEEKKTPWTGISNCRAFVYAGAFLPLSGTYISLLFKSINELIKENRWDDNIHLFFIGTGHYNHKSITEYAKQYKISQFVTEVHQRKPYLHILNYLKKAEGVMVIGSTEKHYAASKVFQVLYSCKKIFAIFHEESSAIKVLRNAKADKYTIAYNQENTKEVGQEIKDKFVCYIKSESKLKPDLSTIEKYSAQKCAETLAVKLTSIINTKQ